MIRFLTGLASGLTIAYLTAPRTGKQTRNMVVNFANDEVEGIKIIKNAISKTEEAISQIKG